MTEKSRYTETILLIAASQMLIDLLDGPVVPELLKSQTARNHAEKLQAHLITRLDRFYNYQDGQHSGEVAQQALNASYVVTDLFRTVVQLTAQQQEKLLDHLNKFEHGA